MNTEVFYNMELWKTDNLFAIVMTLKKQVWAVSKRFMVYFGEYFHKLTLMLGTRVSPIKDEIW